MEEGAHHTPRIASVSGYEPPPPRMGAPPTSKTYNAPIVMRPAGFPSISMSKNTLLVTVGSWGTQPGGVVRREVSVAALEQASVEIQVESKTRWR